MPKDNQKPTPEKPAPKKPAKTPEWIREIALGSMAEKEKVKMPPTPAITGARIETEKRPTRRIVTERIKPKLEPEQIKKKEEAALKIRERLKNMEEVRKKEKEKARETEERMLEEEKRIDELLKSKFG